MRAQAHGALLALVIFTLLACKQSGIRDESKVERYGAPADVDLRRATSKLDCAEATAATPRGEACRVAKDYATATPFTTWPTAGQEVWFGHTHKVVPGQKETTAYYFVQIRPGSTPSMLSAAQLKFELGVVGAARDLIPESPAEEADALTVFNAARAGKPVGTSAAVSFMRTAKRKAGDAAIANCDAGSFVLLQRARIYGRKSGERMVLVEPHEKGGGWFSELWKLP